MPALFDPVSLLGGVLGNEVVTPWFRKLLQRNGIIDHNSAPSAPPNGGNSAAAAPGVSTAAAALSGGGLDALNPLMGQLDEPTRRSILVRALMQGGAGILQGVGQGRPTAAILGSGAMDFLGGIDQATAMALLQQQRELEQKQRGAQAKLVETQQQALEQQLAEKGQQREALEQLANSLPDTPDMQTIRQGVLAGDRSSLELAYSILMPSKFVTGPGGAVGISGPGGVTRFAFPPVNPYTLLGDIPGEAPPAAPVAPQAQPGMLSRAMGALSPPATLESGMQAMAGRQAAEAVAAEEQGKRDTLTTRIESLMGKPDTTKFGIPVYSRDAAKNRVAKLSLGEAKAALADIEAGYESAGVAIKPRAVEFAYLLRQHIKELEGK